MVVVVVGGWWWLAGEGRGAKGGGGGGCGRSGGVGVREGRGKEAGVRKYNPAEIRREETINACLYGLLLTAKLIWLVCCRCCRFLTKQISIDASLLIHVVGMKIIVRSFSYHLCEKTLNKKDFGFIF